MHATHTRLFAIIGVGLVAICLTIWLLPPMPKPVSPTKIRDEDKLTRASKKGDLKEVRRLLDQGVSPNARDIATRPAIAVAVQQGHTEILELLLARGADVDVPDYAGHTALMYAVRAHRTDMMRLLLERGANVNAVYDDECTAGTALTLAVIKNCEECVRLLLDQRGVDVDKSAGWHAATPLMHAVKRRKYNMALMLLEKGANVSKRAGQQESPLKLACKNGNSRLCELLRKYATKGKDPQTPALPLIREFESGGRH